MGNECTTRARTAQTAPVKERTRAYDDEPMAAGAARIVYVGHSTVLVEMEGVRLLTDPLLRPRFLHLRRTDAVVRPALDEVDAVLVSHLHFDHLDLPSLRLLGHDVRVVVPRGAGDLLARKGFGSVTELGVDLRHVATIAGVPRFLFGSAARDAARWVKALLRGDRGERFAAETQLWYFGGQLRERFRLR